jgi:hypothetical protein
MEWSAVAVAVEGRAGEGAAMRNDDLRREDGHGGGGGGGQQGGGPEGDGAGCCGRKVYKKGRDVAAKQARADRCGAGGRRRRRCCRTAAGGDFVLTGDDDERCASERALGPARQRVDFQRTQQICCF